MPRLGGDEAGPRHEAAAYEGIHRRNNNPFQIRTILIILTLTLILRNLLFTVSTCIVVTCARLCLQLPNYCLTDSFIRSPCPFMNHDRTLLQRRPRLTHPLIHHDSLWLSIYRTIDRNKLGHYEQVERHRRKLTPLFPKHPPNYDKNTRTKR